MVQGARYCRNGSDHLSHCGWHRGRCRLDAVVFLLAWCVGLMLLDAGKTFVLLTGASGSALDES